MGIDLDNFYLKLRIEEYIKAHANLVNNLKVYFDIYLIGGAIRDLILEKEPKTLERFEKFARNVWNLDGEGKQLALKGIEALENFFKENDIPMTLSELNIDDTHFEEMAKHVSRNDRMLNSYVSLTVDDVVEIYKSCL